MTVSDHTCINASDYFKGVSKESAVQNSNAKGGTPITKEDRSQRYTRSRFRSKSKSLQQITSSSQHLQKTTTATTTKISRYIERIFFFF